MNILIGLKTRLLLITAILVMSTAAAALKPVQSPTIASDATTIDSSLQHVDDLNAMVALQMHPQ